MKLDLFRICSNCNKEFKITEYSEGQIDIIVSFQDCPHCKNRNDIWVSARERLCKD